MTPPKLNVWLSILVSGIILINAAMAVERRYTKETDFLELAEFTKANFIEFRLEDIQEKINRIKAIPPSKRASWQVKELLRLEAAKEAQLRRLNNS